MFREAGGYLIIVIIIVGLLLCVAYFFSNTHKKEIIKKLKSRMDKMVSMLSKTYPEETRVQRLKARYIGRTEFFESIFDETYTLNKGEAVAMCLKDFSKDNSDDINSNTHDDMNLLTFVGLHEMAHIMSASIDHKGDFWPNFKFLLENAVRWDLYKPIDYQFNPTNYCKMVIYDNPYFYERTPQDFADRIIKIIK